LLTVFAAGFAAGFAGGCGFAAGAGGRVRAASLNARSMSSSAAEAACPGSSKAALISTASR